MNKFLPEYDFFTTENIYKAWLRFKNGKKYKQDVTDFELNLISNLKNLRDDLISNSYVHGKYYSFTIVEVKKREIHKASVRDRVVHHLLYDSLYKYFDNKFIYDSYSCRKDKGTHKALERYKSFLTKSSDNFTKQAYILKFDIQKCFASIDHSVLKNILYKHIQDKDILNLLNKILDSHISNDQESIKKVGIPLGNLTSQLFINIYLNELDFYCKHVLKLKYYIRYADDVIIILKKEESTHKYENKATEIVSKVDLFCKANLKLNIHKVEMKTINSGVDFLGWVHFSKYRVLRKVTKRKMLETVNKKNVTSYLGLLKWGNGYKLNIKLLKLSESREN